MTIKKCSCIMICLAVVFASLGIFSSFAGGSDAVFVNGYPTYPGDEIVVNIIMNKTDNLISTYSGTITYDSNLLTPVEVTNTYGNTVCNVELDNKIKFAAADGINGMKFDKDTTVLSLKYIVNNEKGENTKIEYKFDELYKFNKEKLTDTKIEDTTTLSNMEIQFISNNSEDKNVTPTEESKPDTNITPTEESKPDTNVTPTEESKPDTNVTPTEESKPDTNVTPTEESEPDTNVTPTEESKPDTNVTPTEENKKDTNIVDNNNPSDSKPSVNNDCGKTVPSVNINGNDKGSSSSNGGTQSNNSSNGNSGNGTSNPGNSSSNNSSGSSSINNDDYVPDVVVDGSGDVVETSTDYNDTTDDNISTGDNAPIKSKILIGLASLLGCGGVGGLIKSYKKTLYY